MGQYKNEQKNTDGQVSINDSFTQGQNINSNSFQIASLERLSKVIRQVELSQLTIHNMSISNNETAQITPKENQERMNLMYSNFIISNLMFIVVALQNYFQQSIFNNTSSINISNNNYLCLTYGVGRDSESQQSNTNSLEQIAITEIPEIVHTERIESRVLRPNAFRKYLQNGGSPLDSDTIRQLGCSSKHQQKKSSAYISTNIEINLLTCRSDKHSNGSCTSKGRIKFHGGSPKQAGESRRLSIERGDNQNGFSQAESQSCTRHICNSPKRTPAQIHLSNGRQFSNQDQWIEISMGQGNNLCSSTNSNNGEMFIKDTGGEYNSNLSSTRLGIMVDSSSSSNGTKVSSVGSLGSSTNIKKIEDQEQNQISARKSHRTFDPNKRRDEIYQQMEFQMKLTENECQDLMLEMTDQLLRKRGASMARIALYIDESGVSISSFFGNTAELTVRRAFKH
ncbi:MAG: hypothetical protein EZS28_018099 [Streblomastix strix]|uniref:Uncharacterized protein n=1 Tax=Streblomastix strix TaxID=222440 RepID=A0A5J4VV33_9EUKA|nr:MAG: hypothetical protein EZS28_018099 [Streblomastix strix]